MPYGQARRVPAPGVPSTDRLNLYPTPIADGTVIGTSPTGHTYTTKPGSALLFPTLCLPTDTLWPPGHEPKLWPGHNRGLMMPKRRRTRAENLARRIEAERKLNDDYVAERNRPPPF